LWAGPEALSNVAAASLRAVSVAASKRMITVLCGTRPVRDRWLPASWVNRRLPAIRGRWERFACFRRTLGCVPGRRGGPAEGLSGETRRASLDLLR
jgi:hypothetical protein